MASASRLKEEDSPQKKAKKLFVILDGNAIVHRSFHAIRPLHTKDGEQVNAIYGFTSILLTILSNDSPNYIACAFDTKAPTFRHEQYKEYKATRKKAPDELYAQIPRIHQIVEALSVPKLMQDGFEADDLMGSIAKRVEREHPEMLIKIITSDMDAFQLVNENICVADLHKGYSKSTCYFSEDVKEKYGLLPNQIVDFKALAGDPSDNIPGVKGIGKKGATELLQRFGSLDGIYQNLSQIKGKKHEILESQKKEAYFSRELATIKTDCPLNLNLDDCKAHDFDLQRVLKLFEELEFFSLTRRLKLWKASEGFSESEVSSVFGTPAAKPEHKEAQMKLF